MSQFTKFIHEHFGTSPDQSAANILVGLAGNSLGTARELVADVVAMLEGTGLDGSVKKQLATTIINFFLARTGIHLPPALVSYLIEEAVLLLKGGKASVPAPVPAPAPAPTAPYDTPTNAPVPDTAALITLGFKSGDWLYVKKDKSQWEVTHSGGVLNADVWDGPFTV